MNPWNTDRRRLSVENLGSRESIPFLGGRPDHENVIGKNDIINLKIVLNTTADVQEFLKNVG